MVMLSSLFISVKDLKKMKMFSQLVVLFLLLLPLASTEDLLKNADFESPPSSLPQSLKSPFIALSTNNTLPGWTFEGNVTYVTSSTAVVSLPGDGHGVQLGDGGKINQTFVASGELTDYLLTFAVSRGGVNCSVSADLVVSAPDSGGVFSFKEKYGKYDWQYYGLYLGMWGDGESANLVINSQANDSSESDSVCWPVIDNLLLKNLGKNDSTLKQGNLLLNGGFELGPEIPSNSSEGVLIDTVTTPSQSPLTDWSVTGIVRYIDSDHFFVPQGKYAIELVSGVSTSIQAGVQILEGSVWNLTFKLGDANNLCVGDFVVGAQAGPEAKNFTLSSTGLGSAKNFSVSFKAGSGGTVIRFISYSLTQTKDGNLCGPVIDDVVLSSTSSGTYQTVVQWKFLVALLMFAMLPLV